VESQEYDARTEKMKQWSQELTTKILEIVGGYSQSIYHYTDTAGLVGILSTGKIWATHVAKLNDSTEYDYGFSLVEGFVRNYSARSEALKEKAISDLIPRETYISCFSGTTDLLSQWRAYSGTNVGFCIGFNGTQLATLDSRMPLLEKVIYKKETAEAVVSLLMEEADAYPYNNDFGEVEVGYLLGTLAGLLNVTACIIKHPSFSEENEYRQIYQPGTTELELDVKHRTGQFGLTPYVEIGMENGRLPIESITIGPCKEPDLEHTALDSLLFANGYEDVNVLYSAVPLRV
jgi:hypothetical protein